VSPTKVLRKLRKAGEKAARDGNPAAPVVIVLETGATVRGVITKLDARNEPFGAPGEQVPGPTSLTLTIEVVS
jgi:hypothetical protein